MLKPAVCSNCGHLSHIPTPWIEHAAAILSFPIGLVVLFAIFARPIVGTISIVLLSLGFIATSSWMRRRSRLREITPAARNLYRAMYLALAIFIILARFPDSSCSWKIRANPVLIQFSLGIHHPVPVRRDR